MDGFFRFGMALDLEFVAESLAAFVAHEVPADAVEGAVVGPFDGDFIADLDCPAMFGLSDWRPFIEHTMHFVLDL